MAAAESVERLRANNKPHSYTTETLKQAQKKELQDLKTKGTARSDNQTPDCLRIVLIGKTGGGKSSSGNTILGKKTFEAKMCAKAVTQRCEKTEVEVDGRPVAVVDTPGLFDTSLSNDQVIDEMSKCINLLAPGPHVFLLVIQIGRFTEEEKKTLEYIEQGFGKDAKKYSMILFTHGDELEDNVTIEKFIEENSSLKKLISDCGDRYHMFENKTKSDRTQVKDLIKKIDDLVKENGGGCYTNDMLQEAEAAIKKETERILKEKEEEMRREREEMKRKYQQEIKEIEKQKQRREKELREKEQELRKREQEKREEEERQHWEQKRKESGDKSKQTTDYRTELQKIRRQMEEEREHWEKQKREDEKRRQEEKRKLKKLQNDYKQEQDKYDKRLKEDQIRQKQEIKYLEERHKKEVEELRRFYEAKARKQAEKMCVLKGLKLSCVIL